MQHRILPIIEKHKILAEHAEGSILVGSRKKTTSKMVKIMAILAAAGAPTAVLGAACALPGMTMSGTAGNIIDVGELDATCCVAANTVMVAGAFAKKTAAANMVTVCPSTAFGGCVSETDTVSATMALADENDGAITTAHHGKLPTDMAIAGALSVMCKDNMKCGMAWVKGAAGNPTGADLNAIAAAMVGTLEGQCVYAFTGASATSPTIECEPIPGMVNAGKQMV
jgi:hypothetical protein